MLQGCTTMLKFVNHFQYTRNMNLAPLSVHKLAKHLQQVSTKDTLILFQGDLSHDHSTDETSFLGWGR